MVIRNRLVARCLPRWFPIENHPFIRFERHIGSRVTEGAVLLDAGCGHTAELAKRFSEQAARTIGIDVTDFDPDLRGAGITVVSGLLDAIPLADNSVDLIVARAVVEHLPDPLTVFREIRRVLKPGGRFIFLTPNAYHYASVVARLVPNRFHAAIENQVEHRPERDTFPVHYCANTMAQVQRHASAAGLEVSMSEYAGQYPGYLVFSFPLFVLGSLYEKAIEKLESLAWLRRWLLVEFRKPVMAASDDAVESSVRRLAATV
jgi:SAM-dependent methyltransferase